MSASAAVVEVGIAPGKRAAIHPVLYNFSLGDFKHDFGHSKIVKENSNLNDSLNTVPLDTKISYAQRGFNINFIRQEISAKIIAYNKGKSKAHHKRVDNWTLYDQFRDEMIGYLPPYPGLPASIAAARAAGTTIAKDEDTLVDEIFSDTTMERIKQTVTTASDPYTIHVGRAAFTRTYNVTGSMYYNRGTKYTLANVFNTVTSGKTVIGILEDASKLPISELTVVNAANPLRDGLTMNFNILQSIENDSDPANKTSNYKPDTALLHKFFLKDIGATNVYPEFSIDNPSENTNVYTRFMFETRRNNQDMVDGTFTIDGDKITIPDLGDASQISKASSKILELYVEKYARGGMSATNKNIMLSYFNIKKFGDWCQALCLLDTTRVYTKMNQRGDVVGVTTIGEMLNEANSTAAILTGDRILLAFALLLGINVFFTIELKAEDQQWLVFFNNEALDKSEVPKAPIETTLGALKADLEGELAKIRGAKASIEASTIDIPGGALATFEATLIQVREKYYKLSNLSTAKITAIIMEIDNLLAKLRDTAGDVVFKRDFQTELITNQIADLKAANTAVLAYTMPSDEIGILQELISDIRKGVNFSKSPVQKRFDILLNTIRDTKGVLPRVTTLTDAAFEAPAGRRIALLEVNKKALLAMLNKTLVSHPQAGGTLTVPAHYEAQLKDAFNELRQNQIVLVENTSKDITQCSDGVDYDAVERVTAGYFISKPRNYVFDRHMNYCSVVDKYIVTIDDCPSFISSLDDAYYIIKGININVSAEHKADANQIDDAIVEFINNAATNVHTKMMYNYITLRFFLLWHDILYTEMMGLNDDPQEKDEGIELLEKRINIFITELEPYARATRSKTDFNARYANILSVKRRYGTTRAAILAATSAAVKPDIQNLNVILRDIRAYLFDEYNNTRLFRDIFKEAGQPPGKTLKKWVSEYEGVELISQLTEVAAVAGASDEIRASIHNEDVAIEAVKAVCVEANSAASGGYRRRTRRRYQLKGRKTRRHP